MRGNKKLKLSWRKLALFALATILVGFLLTFRLGSLPGNGMSAPEAAATQHSSSWHQLLSVPFFLPLTALQRGLDAVLPFSSIVDIRLASAAFGIVGFWLVLYILQRWYGQRAMILGGITVAVASWFLHVARSGGVDIHYFVALPALLAAHIYLYTSEKPGRALPVWLLVMGLSLYIPGMVWFVLLNCYWQRSELMEGFRELTKPWQWALLVLICGLVLLPLAYGAWQHPTLEYVVTWLGLPQAVPAWAVVGKSLLASISFIGIWTPANPALWLGHLPVLDVFMLIMFVAGIAFYVSHWKADRSKFLLALFVLSLLLVAAQGPASRSLIVPLLYLMAAGGIAYVLHLWLKVFPKNPLARSTGIALLIVVLALSCLYNVRRYFIAWPHNPATKQAFTATARPAATHNLLYWTRTEEEL